MRSQQFTHSRSFEFPGKKIVPALGEAVFAPEDAALALEEPVLAVFEAVLALEESGLPLEEAELEEMSLGATAQCQRLGGAAVGQSDRRRSSATL